MLWVRSTRDRRNRAAGSPIEISPNRISFLCLFSRQASAPHEKEFITFAIGRQCHFTYNAQQRFVIFLSAHEKLSLKIFRGPVTVKVEACDIANNKKDPTLDLQTAEAPAHSWEDAPRRDRANVRRATCLLPPRATHSRIHAEDRRTGIASLSAPTRVVQGQATPTQSA